MARHVNATFAGCSVFDADTNAPSYTRAIENAVGDVALIHDMLTGLNSPATTITHQGSGTGALLGIPLVNQYIGRDLHMTNVKVGSTDGDVGETMILTYILFIPPGETDLAVCVWMRDVTTRMADWGQPRVVVTDTSLTELSTVYMTMTEEGEGVTKFAANVSDLTGGSLVILSVRVNTDLLDLSLALDDELQVARLMSCSIYHARKLPGRFATASASDTVTSTIGVTTPSATEAVAHVDFHATMFTDYDPIDGYTTAYLNRNINGLMEFGSGWPAGDEGEYTHVDHDGAGVADSSDPARSRFHACSRSLAGMSAEPELHFPVWAECFGAVNTTGWITNLAEPATGGMLDWQPPHPIAITAQNIIRLPIQYPDFQTTSSRLTCVVLFSSTDPGAAATVPTWSARINTSAGTTTSATPVQCGSSIRLWTATISAVAFTGDDSGTTSIQTIRSGAGRTAMDEIQVLAACLYFDP